MKREYFHDVCFGFKSDFSQLTAPRFYNSLCASALHSRNCVTICALQKLVYDNNLNYPQ